MKCMRVVANSKELKNDTMTLAANGLVNNTKITAIKRPGKPSEAAILAHRARKLEGAHSMCYILIRHFLLATYCQSTFICLCIII